MQSSYPGLVIKWTTRAGKYKFGARAHKDKLGDRVGRYKLGAKASKYKLGARTRVEGQATGRGSVNTNSL